MKRGAVVSAALVVPLLIILQSTGSIACAIAAGCFLVAFILGFAFKKKQLVFVFGFLFAAALSCTLFMFLGPEHDGALDGLTLKVNATVERKYNENSYLLKINSANYSVSNVNINGKVDFYDYSEKEYNEQDIIEGSLTLKSKADRSFFARGYSEGAYLIGYAQEEFSVVGKQEPSVFNVSAHLRAYVKSVCRRIGENEGGLALSLLTGNKTDMDTQTVNAFRDCGLAHIMAVSGLHLSIITGAVLFIIDRFELNRKIRIALSFLLILFVMTLAAFSFSVLRAGIMGVVLIISYLLGRKNDSVNSLGVAVTVICIGNPFAVGNIGFALSVSATFGILVIMPLIYKYVYKIKFKPIRYLVTCFAVSLSATAFILPLSAYIFSKVSLVGFLLCVFVNIAVSLIMVLTLMLCAVWFIPGISHGIIFIVKYICKGFISLVTYCSGFKYATVTLKAAPLFIFCGAILIFFIARSYIKKKELRKPLVISCVTVLFAVSLSCAFSPDFSDSFVNVYGEDKMFITVENSEGLGIIDCASNSAIKQINPKVNEDGIGEIELYVIPRATEERIEALKYFLKRYKIKKIIVGDVAHGLKYDIIDLITDPDCELIFSNGGNSFVMGNVALSFYGTEEGIVSRINCGDFGFLYLPEFSRALPENLPKSDILLISGNSLKNINELSNVSPSYIGIYNNTNKQFAQFRFESKNKSYGIFEQKGDITVAVNKNSRYTVYESNL